MSPGMRTGKGVCSYYLPCVVEVHGSEPCPQAREFGPYRIVRRLGMGRMAETFEAVRSAPSRRRAAARRGFGRQRSLPMTVIAHGTDSTIPRTSRFDVRRPSLHHRQLRHRRDVMEPWWGPSPVQFSSSLRGRRSGPFAASRGRSRTRPRSRGCALGCSTSG